VAADSAIRSSSRTTREAIDYYERRAQNPTLDLIQKLAEAFRGDRGRVAGQ